MQQLVAAVGRAVHVLTVRGVLTPAGLEQRSAGTSSCREVSLQTAGRSESWRGSRVFDKVQNSEAPKPKPQSCGTGGVVRRLVCVRGERGAGAL